MLIRLENIYKIYGEGLESEVRALDGVSLTIDRGEFVAIAGASGSGKSTMMNVLGCLDIPTYGEYWLDGQNVRELTDKQLSHIRNKQIGFIFQGYNLIPELTALENVELPLIYRELGPASVRNWRSAPWSVWGWAAAADTGPRKCLAASSSVWPLPGLFPPVRLSLWPTNPRERWIPKQGRRCWRFFSSSTVREAQ